jgi:3',5'-cyclic AMP phosphodiesterase CpdA
MQQQWNVLHLTDLHFGNLSDESLFLDDNKEKIAASYRDSIINRFTHVLQQGQTAMKVDAIIVSGDITTRGAEDGFEFFSEKIFPHLSKLVDSPSAICIVPGNHDVVWNLSRSDKDLFDKKFEKFGNMVRQVGATTCLIPTGTVSETADSALEFLELDRNDSSPVYIDEEKKLLILCINSAIRCGEVNEKRRSEMEVPLNETLSDIKQIRDRVRYTNQDAKEMLDLMEVRVKNLKDRAALQTIFDVAHVTESQVIRLSGKMQSLKEKYSKQWDSFLRIAVMHHHLMPFSKQTAEHKTYDLVTDAANVRDFLSDFQFHVMLTGHKHQPYTQIHTLRENRLLVAGGPTIGGMPVTGYEQGFRHLKVSFSEVGKRMVSVADISLDVQLVNQPVSQLTKRISQAEQHTLDDTHRRVCLLPSPPPITYDATEDLSDESLMFINVVSCRKAREAVKSYLLKLIRKGEMSPLSYVGFYDLYGHYDLLIRIDDPSLKGDKGIKLLSRIADHLEKTGHKHQQSSEVTMINLLGAQPFSGDAKHTHNLFPDQSSYEALRSHRAFILVTKFGNWNPREREAVKTMARGFYDEYRDKLVDPTDWSISWGQRDIIIEVLVRCGQYYNLQELTRRLEKLVDQPNQQKMTHIVYYHEEYCPLTDQIEGRKFEEGRTAALAAGGSLG